MDAPVEREKKVEGVIFIQYTPHSELAKTIRERLKEIEKVCKVKIKIVEKAGNKIEELLHKSNPWSKQDCLREDCLPCNSAGENGAKGACNKRSNLYETYCEYCGEIDESQQPTEIKRKGKEDVAIIEKNEEKMKRKWRNYKVRYIGESWRTAYERGIEHQEDLKNLRVNSHILKHILEVHPGLKLDEVKFGMRIKQQFRSALERQVSEAVEIHQAQRKGYVLLNSKSEYTRCSVPRLKVESNSEQLERLIGEREQEKRLKENIRNLKKRVKDPLLSLCEEIESNNKIKWKKRRLNEEVVMKEIALQEKLEIEKLKRLQKAQKKKEELLERIKKKTEFKIGKSEAWVKKKQKMWRQFREKNEIRCEDEEDIKRELMKRIPERVPRTSESQSDLIEPETSNKEVVKAAKLSLKVSTCSDSLAVNRLSLDQRSTELGLVRLSVTIELSLI